MRSKKCFDREISKCEGKPEIVFRNYFKGRAEELFGPDLILCDQHLKIRNGSRQIVLERNA
jgi:hypothetical protein